MSLLTFLIFSIQAATSSRSLTERRITHIVSVCSDPIPAEAPESGICHLRISVEDVDFADLLIHLPQLCQFIDQAIRSGGVVLVHCLQGLTRSATVVAAYCALVSFHLFPPLRHCVDILSVMCTQRVDATQAMSIVRQGELPRTFV